MQVEGLEAAGRAQGVGGAADARRGGIRAHQGQFADRGAHHLAAESAAVPGVDGEVVEGLAGQLVPIGQARGGIRRVGREPLHRNGPHVPLAGIPAQVER